MNYKQKIREIETKMNLYIKIANEIKGPPVIITKEIRYLKEQEYKNFLHSNKNHLQRFIKEELSKNLDIQLESSYNSYLTVNLILYKEIISSHEVQIINSEEPYY